MPSIIVLRTVLATSIGLGVADVVWINVALVPDITSTSPPETIVTTPSLPAAAAVPAAVEPMPAIEPPAPPSVDSAVGPRAVYFATQSAKLDATAREALRVLASELPTDATLVLEGHADFRGDESVNQRLSKLRAHAVATELAALGIAMPRLQIRYRGEAHAMHTTLDEVWRDRRVEIEIISGGTR